MYKIVARLSVKKDKIEEFKETAKKLIQNEHYSCESCSNYQQYFW